MIEAIIAVAGIVGGFLISIGWYKRGFNDMEKELNVLKSRVLVIEDEGHNTHTAIEVIKQHMGFMECKIDEIHKVIMQPKTVVVSQ